MELRLEYDDSDEYRVDLEQIAATQNLPATIRLLAFDLMKTPYLSLGEFFQKLSDKGLEELIELVNDVEDNENSLQNVMLLTMMLMTAEGLVVSNDDQLHEALNAMVMITCGVSLARKGLVRVFYDNLSFGEDMHHKTIMEKL